jgi:hypothetical protein
MVIEKNPPPNPQQRREATYKRAFLSFSAFLSASLPSIFIVNIPLWHPKNLLSPPNSGLPSPWPTMRLVPQPRQWGGGSLPREEGEGFRLGPKLGVAVFVLAKVRGLAVCPEPWRRARLVRARRRRFRAIGHWWRWKAKEKGKNISKTAGSIIFPGFLPIISQRSW